MTTTPFTFADNVSSSRQNIMDEMNEDQYVPFIINRHLSHFADAVLYANDLNIYHFLTKSAQYSYLLSSLPKRKRFSKWQKKEKDVLIEAISRRFNCNSDKAQDIASLLPEDAKTKIISEVGISDGSNRQSRRGKIKKE